MGLNMDKIRAKYNALKNGGAKGETKNNFWKPQEGEQTIRIVPTPDGDPFRDYWFHYNVGKAMGFLSPKKNFGTASNAATWFSETIHHTFAQYAKQRKKCSRS